MPKVIQSTVRYACQHCDKSFATEKAAEKCEKSCADNQRIQDMKEQLRHECRLTCDSIPAIEAYVQEKLSALTGVPVQVSIRATYSSSVSNTHCCPIDGVTNWGFRDANKPTGYSGYQGQIEITWGDAKLKVKRVHGRTAEYSDYLSSEHIEMFAGLNTGSGGAGSKSCRYEIKLFDADFPKLVESRTIVQELLTKAADAHSAASKNASTKAQQEPEYIKAMANLETCQAEIRELQAKIQALSDSTRDFHHQMDVIYKAKQKEYASNELQALQALQKLVFENRW